MTYLQRILDEKRTEVAELKKQRPQQRYEERKNDLLPCRDFTGNLKRSGDTLRLIAEIKKASPSRGVIVSDFDPVAIARRYLELGASAFSVLTDQRFFQGSIEYLESVKRSFSLPVLRKDFIIDERQIYESRLIGADAILLIAAALEASQLRDYLQLAAETGLAVLVEVHDRQELDVAAEAGAGIIGVNNRNLKDFSVSIDTSIDLRPYFPEGVIAVAESGLKSAADVVRIGQASFDAVLIGEGLYVSPELHDLTWQTP
ncbi:MAG: indole-3-glycerol phosphate synthase TrpC [Chlorobium sp.]|uniref:indole-3-glycerol phosphate synthase TrpC n=1 Tax=Chlorobium sp. TaxID=1095 RepID=UPI0025B8B163|nr:indole-3-glycerol phosphate synthase TrpC [Chlorobium sp.]MCF8216751.1 indole-3-glycerol phosphate synthase TrpC [Chlorobium sp.]MCF8271619.1 indole-3-glycerol phosphate synthase TrpC [Chlorobium sp.]MCF8287991.1 indole-3-glycerol phosphate synthase TrpC [Chlorobium sp.]MCF8291536.1 indole-3-glycerol phosphate synthase TrpC [Chlorobium sp.]MCF8385670.1 indole-3-glycerol phosphate synthase TrpC [Chlorobium sp.]